MCNMLTLLRTLTMYIMSVKRSLLYCCTAQRDLPLKKLEGGLTASPGCQGSVWNTANWNNYLTQPPMTNVNGHGIFTIRKTMTYLIYDDMYNNTMIMICIITMCYIVIIIHTHSSGSAWYVYRHPGRRIAGSMISGRSSNDEDVLLGVHPIHFSQNLINNSIRSTTYDVNICITKNYYKYTQA